VPIPREIEKYLPKRAEINSIAKSNHNRVSLPVLLYIAVTASTGQPNTNMRIPPIEGALVSSQKGGRRTPLAMILLLLVAVSIVLGFLLPEHNYSNIVAVDLRENPVETKDQDTLRKSTDPVVVVGRAAQFDTNSCQPVKRPLTCYLDVISDKSIMLVSNDTTEMTKLLRSLYGPDIEIEEGNGVWQGRMTTSTRFNPLAAFLSFGVLGALCVLVFSTQLRRPAGVQADSRGTAPAPPRQYQPQRELAGVAARPSAGPPPAPRPVSAVQSAPPAREIASELMPLVTKAKGHGVARTHITARGGYVAVGDVVLWATLRPSEEAVVVPDDRLKVLAVDEETETLVVAPADSTATERGLRP
jgi:hypothetical protein